MERACPATFEVHVQGNVVNGIYIAGLIFISQQSLNSSQGFIESLDYATGTMVVNGTRVQINDPIGRFSIGQSPDVRFSIDEDNPTVRARTAFPMCIPRQDPAAGDDPLCPQKNRPRDSSGNALTTFTMDPRGAAPSPASPLPTDSTAFAPFEVGDFVTYAGTLMDGPNGRFISAHTVIANVGIYTTPGDDPAYIAIDVVLQGAPGIPNPGFPQEATAKVRVEGFSTDPSRPIDIFAVDQDCNGVISERAPWAFEFPVEQGPPTAGAKGRYRFLPAGGAFLPPPRNIGVRIDYPAPAVYNTTLGIVAGRYQAPNFTYIFPENLSIGAPPVPLNFNDLTFLVNGSGGWGGYGNQPIGQLNPWPGRICSQPDLHHGSRWYPASATGSISNGRLHRRCEPDCGRDAGHTERCGQHTYQRPVCMDTGDCSGRSDGNPRWADIIDVNFYSAHGCGQQEPDIPGKCGRRELLDSSSGNRIGADRSTSEHNSAIHQCERRAGKSGGQRSKCHAQCHGRRSSRRNSFLHMAGACRHYADAFWKQRLAAIFHRADASRRDLLPEVLSFCCDRDEFDFRSHGQHHGVSNSKPGSGCRDHHFGCLSHVEEFVNGERDGHNSRNQADLYVEHHQSSNR